MALCTILRECRVLLVVVICMACVTVILGSSCILSWIAALMAGITIQGIVYSSELEILVLHCPCPCAL